MFVTHYIHFYKSLRKNLSVWTRLLPYLQSAAFVSCILRNAGFFFLMLKKIFLKKLGPWVHESLLKKKKKKKTLQKVRENSNN